MKLLNVVGSYEKSIYGVDLSVEKKSDDQISIEDKIAFAFPAHTGYIKSISSCQRFLATGSTDETVRIFDLKKRKDYGTLALHSGSITCLEFYNSEFLLSAGEDGQLAFTRCKDWETLQKIKAHSHGVVALAIHPTGKLALTAGADKKLKLWDLTKGKLAHAERAVHSIQGIKWSPDGSLYVLFGDKNLTIYKTKGAEVVFKMPNPGPFKVLTAAFRDNDQLIACGEGSKIAVIQISSGKLSVKETNQKPRIRSIFIENDLVFTASSDGSVLIWNGNDLSFEKPIHTIKTGLRITCQTVTTQ
jgi:protein MAK11